ncbi:hypothetical protein FE782_09280 [Paenibacillus antri]|uniref:Sugar phosphate isomerase/epimerase n=1 Tax=Paenibacillus antri TaxID=2582848 RepID=A0A5R9GIX1_9BACL|nr:hypothetical protein [Paenibacillus antri]TLS52803.1 hypothetical protein FE782_09280 [Paenibacillus antri]
MVTSIFGWLTDKEIGDALVAPYTAHAQFDRAFVDFTGPELIQKVRLLHQQGYKGCWSLEHRSGTNEYLEVERDLLDLRLAVKRIID